MTKRRLLTLLKYVFLFAMSLLSIFPLLWMAVSATNRSVDVVTGRLIPGTYLVENFRNLAAQHRIGLAMWNSFRNSIAATIASLAVCSIAGYGFEIYHDKGKDWLMRILLLSMMIPFAAIMIPLFMMVGKLGLLNTTTAFVLPTVSTAFMIFLFRQSARYFPSDIIEAARLEGMSELGIFFKMYVPIMRSTYVTAGIITFMNAWNSYLWPLIIMQSKDSIVMPLLISNLIAGYVTDYGMVMLGVTLSVLPTVILFLLLQNSFAEGILSSMR
ncbi:MAG TPA: carbohydrate ABC transporter permease [Firmicutes bacterium]|nr:carbohydrate ABC transporter permease [Bacillota bacterium]